ncbi:DedA family protein [Pseudobacteroides cellulosolvens]|uniref:SNARE associated protein n=1 Tax=Pseudobacteroides cellulosolvens ATCC 35603 = DSM 2933 TaxID=398512 RepID=A0A0L6JK94_9FIRM|nr:DedA family protein [Pseudobacteroides cellulosolvens]KNY26276.1 SNARE associated protein [Pseudobacteroides cellulosolvens ATCC 35603 = DSM 2933]
MDLIMQLIDFVLHIDKHLAEIIKDYGAWTYMILFLIIFCETGLVVTPFLPGDSFLFALGALHTSLDIKLAYILLVIAAILGNTTNYLIGKFIGTKMLEFKKIRLVKQEHLDRTHAFFDKHGGKAIILSRFFPIIRTFAPFVAGLGKMSFGRYTLYNAVGGVSWITTFILLGYFFGNIPAVKENFTFVIIGIVVVTFLPAAITFIKGRKSSKK